MSDPPASSTSKKNTGFGWFSILQYRRYGRESLSYLELKLTGKFRPNPILDRATLTPKFKKYIFPTIEREMYTVGDVVKIG